MLSDTPVRCCHFLCVSLYSSHSRKAMRTHKAGGGTIGGQLLTFFIAHMVRGVLGRRRAAFRKQLEPIHLPFGPRSATENAAPPATPTHPSAHPSEVAGPGSRRLLNLEVSS